MLKSIGTTALSASELQPNVFNACERRYTEQLEKLKSTLFDLGNPYLLSFIGERLNQVSRSYIDVSNTEQLIAYFNDPKIPSALLDEWTKFATCICHFGSADLSRLNQRVREIKNQIAQLTSELTSNNRILLKNYAGWEDFQRLFSLPAMMALSDGDFKTMVQYIDNSDVEKLNDYVTALAEQNNLHLKEAKESLTQNGYEYDLPTLLAQVIDSKPVKEGVFTSWDRPDAFFTHKKLCITPLHDDGLEGTITKSSKTSNQDRKFHLHVFT